uniref:mitochondrial fission 1 protein A-like n=1 Tax=Erigeron canadensis TaxID=72917 RepID=UPI001CB891CB|nr:mitochondrial fission 1 protein A-like [Erigeron canadensis]
MLFEAIRSFFTPGYSFSLCNSTLIHFCRRDYALVENRLDSSYDDIRNECLLRLSWALAHSRRPEDVQHGIRMLEGEKGSSDNTDDTLQMKLKAYILAVGYYRSVIEVGTTRRAWTMLTAVWRLHTTGKRR